MEKQVEALRTLFEARIDFKGQEKASELANIILLISGLLGFVIGFVIQSAATTFIIFGVGFFVASLVALPAWSAYNSNPVKWLNASPTTAIAAAADAKEEKRKDE